MDFDYVDRNPHTISKHDSNVHKLKDLGDRDDHICIAIHGNVPFLEACLEKKAKMKYLELCFLGDGHNKEIAQCIEELVPPPNLRVLRIDDYLGLTLPKWIISDSISNKLKMLSVRSSPHINSFPSLWRLSHLQFLWIFDIPSIKCLGLEFFGCLKRRKHEEISGGETAFPSLKKVRFEYMQNWESWEDIDVVEADKKGIKVMPSLEELIIADCPKLQKKPLRILRDTPWFKKEYKPDTSKDKETEIQHYGPMNEQTNDNPSTSNSKGKESEIESLQDSRE